VVHREALNDLAQDSERSLGPDRRGDLRRGVVEVEEDRAAGVRPAVVTPAGQARGQQGEAVTVGAAAGTWAR